MFSSPQLATHVGKSHYLTEPTSVDKGGFLSFFHTLFAHKVLRIAFCFALLTSSLSISAFALAREWGLLSHQHVAQSSILFK